MYSIYSYSTVYLYKWFDAEGTKADFPTGPRGFVSRQRQMLTALRLRAPFLSCGLLLHFIYLISYPYIKQNFILKFTSYPKSFQTKNVCLFSRKGSLIKIAMYLCELICPNKSFTRRSEPVTLRTRGEYINTVCQYSL